jgi:hypothetical protein
MPITSAWLGWTDHWEAARSVTRALSQALATNDGEQVLIEDFIQLRIESYQGVEDAMVILERLSLPDNIAGPKGALSPATRQEIVFLFLQLLVDLGRVWARKLRISSDVLADHLPEELWTLYAHKRTQPWPRFLVTDDQQWYWQPVQRQPEIEFPRSGTAAYTALLDNPERADAKLELVKRLPIPRFELSTEEPVSLVVEEPQQAQDVDFFGRVL